MNFDNKQIDFIFSDSNFISFVSNYFSSYETSLHKINAGLFDNKDYFDEFFVYMRVVLANLKQFINLFRLLLKKVSYQYKKEHEIFKGQIKGKLMINYYIKEISNRNMPKNYHCLIKEQSYMTPENMYIVFGLHEIIARLEKCVKEIHSLPLINKENNTELRLISYYLNEIKENVNKSYFIECNKSLRNFYSKYGHTFPKDQRNLIERRIKRGKIVNKDIYKKIIYWLDDFCNNNSLFFVNDETLNFLRYDGKAFSDKLFELWCLFKINETLIKEFGFKQENNQIKFGGEPIFSIFNNNEKLKIYYQKGKNIYWNESYHQIWSYINDGHIKRLTGIPDISIIKENVGKSIVMIDVKNKIRRGGDNSEEIYKMIGYFSNFSDIINKYYENSVNNAILIFRNDEKSFNEMITNCDKTFLFNISVSPNKNSELCNDQFKLICEHILKN